MFSKWDAGENVPDPLCPALQTTMEVFRNGSSPVPQWWSCFRKIVTDHLFVPKLVSSSPESCCLIDNMYWSESNTKLLGLEIRYVFIFFLCGSPFTVSFIFACLAMLYCSISGIWIARPAAVVGNEFVTCRRQVQFARQENKDDALSVAGSYAQRWRGNQADLRSSWQESRSTSQSDLTMSLRVHLCRSLQSSRAK